MHMLLAYYCCCTYPCACTGAPEDSAAASALSYLLCQKPCNPEDTSGGGATVRTDHWWEVLSAVKALSQESQLHICAMFGAEVSISFTLGRILTSF